MESLETIRQEALCGNSKSQREPLGKVIISQNRRRRNNWNKDENQIRLKNKGMDMMLLFKEVKKPKIYLKTPDKKNKDLLTEELFKDIINEENKQCDPTPSKVSSLEPLLTSKTIVLPEKEMKHQKVNTETFILNELVIDDDENDLNKRSIMTKRPTLNTILKNDKISLNKEDMIFLPDRNKLKQFKTVRTEGNNNTNSNVRKSLEKKQNNKSHCLLRISTKGKNIIPIKNNYSIAHDTKEGFDLERKAHKINQDRLITVPNILKMDNFSLLTVLDGHGQNGHYIAELAGQHIKSYFTDSMKYFISRHGPNGQLSSIKGLCTDNEIYTKLTQKNYEIIKTCMKETQKTIEDSEYENDFSGCTCCNIIIVNGHIICANIGDSRAIVVRSSKNIMQLSRDHKPELSKERKRIEENGGEIKRMNNNIGPLRVWVKGQNYPGIAMTRSLGDKIGKSIGVSSDPEISDYIIDKSDKYLIIASDGIWEHLSNEKIEEIVTPCYHKNDYNTATKLLKEAATNAFINEKQNVDDISIIIVFFPHNQ